MLYEFHRTQNAKRPSSVHATYLVIGRKRRQTTHNGVHIKNEEDMPMESSPIPSSLPVSESEQEVEQIPTTSVTLVKEENLEGKFANYSDWIISALTHRQKLVVNTRRYNLFSFTASHRPPFKTTRF